MAFRIGFEFLNEIADAFGLSKNVRSVRLCVECDSVVTLEVEELVTDEQAKELMPILKRYRLEEIVEPSCRVSALKGEVEVTTASDLEKGVRRFADTITGFVRYEPINHGDIS